MSTCALLLAIGFALFALGLYLNSFLTSESGFAELALPQALRGVALLFCFIPINRLSLATLPPHQLKNASGVFNLTRNLGGAVGLALLNTLIDHREQLHWNHLAARIDPTRPEVQATLDTLAARFSSFLPGDAELAALRQVARIVEREAQVLTFNDAFLGLSVLYLAALLLGRSCRSRGRSRRSRRPGRNDRIGRRLARPFMECTDEQAARLPLGHAPERPRAPQAGALAGASLLGSVPAFVVLAALLALRRDRGRELVAGGLASVLVAAALLIRLACCIGSSGLADWLARAPGAPVAGLPEPLVRPAAELAELLRRHELRIEAQDRTLASVLEAVPDPILVIDARLDVIRVNAAARRDFGIENRRLPLARVLRDPGVLAAVRGTLEAGTASNVTFTPTLYRQRLFSARVEPLDLGEEGPGVLVALREQTEQVMIERMRSDFVANASHEIRNPLASILGIVETLRGPARHDAKGREMFLELLAGEAARMTRLVDDLLSLSRIELAAHQPPTERCEPKALLEQVIERMYAVAAGAKVRLVASIPADLPLIVAIPTSCISSSST